MYDKFTRLRDQRNSLVVLGLDPKNAIDMHKVGMDLIRLRNDLVGFKPNGLFYQNHLGRPLLEKFQYMGDDVLTIMDMKIADGANTNSAGIKDFVNDGFDAVTINTPDVEGTLASTQEHDLGGIIMGAMSFPSTLRDLKHGYGLPMLKDRIKRGVSSGAQGIVLGGTSYVPDELIGDTIKTLREKYDSGSKEHICISDMSDSELETAISRRNELFAYCVKLMDENPQLLALVPGIGGRQGGRLEDFLNSEINFERCMVNAGSAILKADNPTMALKEFNGEINTYRN